MAMAEQYKLLAKIFVGVLGAIASLVAIVEFAETRPKGDVAFECAYPNVLDSSEREYYTIATKNEKQFSVIHWKSENFTEAGYPPQRRCLEVAPRFQEAYDAKELTHVTNGWLNNQPVICTANPDGSCQRLLFTLRKGIDPPLDVLEQLQGTLSGQSIGAIPQSNGNPQVILKVNPDRAFETRKGETGFEVQKRSFVDKVRGLLGN